MKTDVYKRDEIARIIQLRANVEGLQLGVGVLDKLAAEGDRASLRHGVSSLTLLPFD